VLESGEECDDGNTSETDSCTNSCFNARCGDGLVRSGVEACDDGNTTDTDACKNDCTLPGCGDGVLSTGEECDDGNLTDDDGCDSGCIVSTIESVVVGEAHTCVLFQTGGVRCWGAGSAGQLGYGNTNSIGDNETPASAGNVNVGGSVVQIAAGRAHTCALLSTGNVRCWGLNNFGVLGYGNTNDIGDNETPASAGDVNVGGSVIQITSGFARTCALLSTGSVRCWGQGSVLGYGNTNDIGDNETPASAGNVPVF
jgi:cysteine-rich repeat protein